MSVYTYEVEDYVKSCPFCNSRELLRLKGVSTKKYSICCNNSHCKVQPETKWYRIKGLDVVAWNLGWTIK